MYSASKLAAEEFPQFDVSLRSAVSIARRMQDPLAELVKIDPKAIGVGQYQHDLKESQLEEALDGVVEGCVNSVGVEVSTASAPLLSHVAGIGPALAKNIVAYREENGIQSRAQLKKVPKLGPRAFEQCAGFLRVRDSKNALDATAVHPESYDAARALLATLGYRPEDIRSGGLTDLPARVEERGLNALAKELGVGERDFCRFLMEEGFLYRCPAGYLLPYAKPSNKGLFQVKDFWKYGHFRQQTLITPQGKDLLRMMLCGGQMCMEFDFCESEA